MSEGESVYKDRLHTSCCQSHPPFTRAVLASNLVSMMPEQTEASQAQTQKERERDKKGKRSKTNKDNKHSSTQKKPSGVEE